ncbi:defensin-like peptide family protein [Acinetobacter baumannii 83444]|nr:defensin-like peptide family protein [Acinetobacter baumannii 83444]
MLCLFLNGVCRHEHSATCYYKQKDFLNGVCRHEQIMQNSI